MELWLCWYGDIFLPADLVFCKHCLSVSQRCWLPSTENHLSLMNLSRVVSHSTVAWWSTRKAVTRRSLSKM